MSLSARLAAVVAPILVAVGALGVALDVASEERACAGSDEGPDRAAGDDVASDRAANAADDRASGPATALAIGMAVRAAAIGLRIGKHPAPGRRRRRHAEPKEAEPRFGEDVGGDALGGLLKLNDFEGADFYMGVHFFIAKKNRSNSK